MEDSRAKLLLKKYREGTLSEKERILLESWYLELASTKELSVGKEEIGTYLDSIQEIIPPLTKFEKSSTGRFLRWASVAASVLIIFFWGGYWLISPGEGYGSNSTAEHTDALPGDDRALLTLASGESISLDKISSGKLAQEGNMSIIKTQEGEIVYSFVDGTSSDITPVAYNKIETPKAGQYLVVLPDETKAWLNAASSIRFPTVFPVGERVVEVTGEVYFEVAKRIENNKKVPFRVYSGEQAIEVLGTVFNVNSYPEEDVIRTTLIEGSIGVKMKNAPGKDIILKPGQQAQFAAEKSGGASAATEVKVKEVDTETVAAWKEGYFRFDGVGLPELMRQVSRWYDMEVVYEGNLSDYEFVGRIERDARLSKVLKILELGGVKFRIEGRTIVVGE